MRAHLLDDQGTHLRWFGRTGEPGLSGDPALAPTRVFLHGLGSSGVSAFAAVIADLDSARSPWVVPDLLGHGHSDPPADGDLGLEAHAAAIASLLDALGVSAVDLVGHSMGGAIALVMAHRRPDLIGRLVLIEPNLDPWDGGASVWIAHQSEAEFLAQGRETLLRASPPEWAASLRVADPVAVYRSAVGLCEGSVPTMRQILVALAVPRTLVWGALSDPVRDREGLVAAGVAVVEVAESGHVPMDDNPQGFLSAVRGALGA